MKEQEFIDTFLEIMRTEYAKYPQQDITGYKAIEIIRRVFEELGE